MANKLFLVCTSLALCFLLTNASIYRTVVEFDEDDETNPIGPFGPRQKCRKEFQQAQHLRACQQFIRQQARRQSRGGPSLDVDEFDFEDDIDIDIEENRRGSQGQMQGPLLQQCCNELRQEDQVCVCPTLKRAARALSLQGGQQQQQGHQMRQIFQTAKYLPKVCNIPQVSVCPFRTPSYPPQY